MRRRRLEADSWRAIKKSRFCSEIVNTSCHKHGSSIPTRLVTRAKRIRQGNQVESRFATKKQNEPAIVGTHGIGAALSRADDRETKCWEPHGEARETFFNVAGSRLSLRRSAEVALGSRRFSQGEVSGRFESNPI